jgi:hypothetical protein
MIVESTMTASATTITTMTPLQHIEVTGQTQHMHQIFIMVNDTATTTTTTTNSRMITQCRLRHQ